MLVFTACNHQNTAHSHEAESEHEAEHAHAHEGKVSFVGYSSTHEVFIESDPLVSGEPAQMLVHVTSLNDFSPVDIKLLDVQLVNGKYTSKINTYKVLRTGIASSTIIADEAGLGAFQVIINNETANMVQIENVKISGDAHEAYHGEGEAHEGMHEEIIPFTREQAWQVDFMTGWPTLSDYTSIKTSGQIEPAKNDVQHLVAVTSGIVVFPDRSLQEGVAVMKGKSIFSIAGNKLAESSTATKYNEASSAYDIAQNNYKRKKEWIESGVVSEKDLETAAAELKVAEARFNAVQKSFNEAGQVVSSNMDGYITNLEVENGQYVEAGTHLATIIGNKRLVIKAEVQQKYASLLPLIKDANLCLINSGSHLSMSKLNGKVVSYGKTVGGHSYLIPVFIEVDAHKDLIAGSLVNLFLLCDNNQKYVTVPNTALIEEMGLYYVFVQEEAEGYEKRLVGIGNSDGLNTVITSGLSADERVVTKGATYVKLAGMNTALDPHAGHIH